MVTKPLSQFEAISDYLMRPVDASSVGAFRIIFGAVMCWAMCRYFYLDRISSKYIDRTFHSTFPFFDWVTPWPGVSMYYHFGILAIAGLMIAIGLFTRFYSIVFFLGYTYVFLLDVVEYNNHYYFMCLVSFLFCFIYTNRWMSLDVSKKTTTNSSTIPFWNLFILRAQVFIVYFYGGIAKINEDWLRGEPMRHFLLDRFENSPELGKYLTSEVSVYLFSYGGLIYDLVIGFILLCKKTRWLGIILVLIFNLTNNWIFTIGIFPVLMIGATILFLEPETPRKLLNSLFPKKVEPEYESTPYHVRPQKLVILFVSVYLVIQGLTPFRHFLYTGDVHWNGIGHNFSWYMKLNSKNQCRMSFIATDPGTRESWSITNKGVIDDRQYGKICPHPMLVVQYAKYLGRKLEESGVNNPIIRVKSSYSLNYGPVQTLINPEANLLEVDTNPFGKVDWIVPLKK
ncbi:MAG: HTTM domain-containing protein [Nitrospinales bacterium]